MKIVGLITEYNPFHNGHLYHIEKAKEITGADSVPSICGRKSLWKQEWIS